MIVVAGCGHPDRGDDAAGLLVALEIEREIQRAPLPGVRVCFPGTDAFALFDAWAGCDLCILIDAMRSGRPPGAVTALTPADWHLLQTLPDCSTHAFTPAHILRLAESIGALPPRLVVIGVEGRRFQPGAAISPDLHSGIAAAVQLVRTEILNRLSILQ